MVDNAVNNLIEYGVRSGLLPEEERVYAANLLIDALKKDSLEKTEPSGGDIDPEAVLKELLDYAVLNNIINDNIVERDLFDTRLMNCITPRPKTVIDKFNEDYKISPKTATDNYYKFSQDSDYIRRYRIKKDERWKTQTEYGDLDITINLSKPEKDPKAIAAAGSAKSSDYPKCQLCVENEGYAGRLNHPARETLRIIPIEINGEKWGFQYSPYTYYNEHCIALNARHVPMKIDRDTFVKLFDFIDIFPHYFIGSNADLPIVGGSILSHDHFQGGNYEFAMAKAPVEEEIELKDFDGVEAGIIKWPLSVIRLRGKDREKLIKAADYILKKWKGYTDEEAFIFAETDGEPHNTITPIARKRGDEYELDLVLRNNITTEEHPFGVYHPHEELHHIKKENIGLIEVMGLAVLPSRLKGELELLKEYLIQEKDPAENEELKKHADWAKEIVKKYGKITKENADDIIKRETGEAFLKTLEAAGVFKRDEAGKKAFKRFTDTL